MSAKDQFLRAVVGDDGASALAKSATAPALEWSLLPRVVMAWVDQLPEIPTPIPGTSTTLLVKKSETGYHGWIGSGSDVYLLEDASGPRVAATVLAALQISPSQHPPLDHKALPLLGKSIDLLVKSRMEKARAPRHGAASGAPGPAAAPLEPAAPVAPTPTAPKTQLRAQPKPKGASPEKTAQPQPQPQPKKPVKIPGIKIRVTKSEAAKPCPVCQEPQFGGGEYLGCSCFKDLRKSTRTTPEGDRLVVEFGKDWTAADVAALIQNLGDING